VPEPRLREVGMGVWEDRTWGEVEFESPELLRYFNRDPEKWRVDGGEPFAATQARMQNILRELAGHHEGQTIAVVSHGMAIRSLLCAVLDIPSAEVTRIPHADNTAVSLLHAENGILSVEYYNDNSHLPEELSTFARQIWWKLTLDRDISSLRETLLRALRGEETVGLLELDYVRGADEDAGWVSLCYVVPHLRGQRYGVQLLGQAASYFRKLGRRSLQLTVAEDNVRAVGFYLHYGFQEIGRAEGTLGELIVMEKGL
jgi:probable phosphoglycerate mutase